MFGLVVAHGQARTSGSPSMRRGKCIASRHAKHSTACHAAGSVGLALRRHVVVKGGVGGCPVPLLMWPCSTGCSLKVLLVVVGLLTALVGIERPTTTLTFIIDRASSKTSFAFVLCWLAGASTSVITTAPAPSLGPPGSSALYGTSWHSGGALRARAAPPLPPTLRARRKCGVNDLCSKMETTLKPRAVLFL